MHLPATVLEACHCLNCINSAICKELTVSALSLSKPANKTCPILKVIFKLISARVCNADTKNCISTSSKLLCHQAKEFLTLQNTFPVLAEYWTSHSACLGSSSSHAGLTSMRKLQNSSLFLHKMTQYSHLYWACQTLYLQFWKRRWSAHPFWTQTRTGLNQAGSGSVPGVLYSVTKPSTTEDTDALNSGFSATTTAYPQTQVQFCNPARHLSFFNSIWESKILF